MEDFLFTICCPACGRLISKSYKGTKTFISCSRCHEKIYYETGDNGAEIRVGEEPETYKKTPTISV